MSRVTDSGFPAYTELYRKTRTGSGSGINTAGMRVTESVTFRVLNSDYPTFMGFVFGKPETVGGFGGVMIRNVPLRHPRFDGFLARDYSSEEVGFLHGASDSLNTRKYRDVRVDFSPPDYNLDGQKAFVTEQTSPTVRDVPAPPSMFVLNGLAPIENLQYPAAGTNLSLTLHQLPSLDLTTYALYQRRVNNASFFGYDAGTLLYNGPSSNRTTQFGTTTSYEVTHEFSWSSIPWNYEFGPNGTLYEVTYASGTRRFPLANFTALFT